MQNVKNILVPIDFSDVTERVVDAAAQLAATFESKLWLIHVAAPDPYFVGYEEGPQHEREWRAESLSEEHRALQAKAESLRDQGLEATALLIQGPTVEKILEEVAERDIDLVVVGTHEHSLLYSFFSGDVSDYLIHKAPCPILVVPPT